MLKDKYGQWVMARDMLPMLGIPAGHHLPEAGFEKEVDGVIVKCLPAIPSAHKSSRHRIFYTCSACERLIPYGRWGQHIRGHQHVTAVYGDDPMGDHHGRNK